MKKQQAEIEQVEVEKNRASGAVQSSRRVALAREANIRACLVDFEVHTRVFMNSLSPEIIQELNLRQQEPPGETCLRGLQGPCEKKL